MICTDTDNYVNVLTIIKKEKKKIKNNFGSLLRRRDYLKIFSWENAYRLAIFVVIKSSAVGFPVL